MIDIEREEELAGIKCEFLKSAVDSAVEKAINSMGYRHPHLVRKPNGTGKAFCEVRELGCKRWVKATYIAAEVTVEHAFDPNKQVTGYDLYDDRTTLTLAVGGPSCPFDE